MRNVSSPRADGYRMPGEFEYHQGCIMVWPIRPGSWPFKGKFAKPIFTEIAKVISESEQVYMLTDPDHIEEARKFLPPQVRILPMKTEDAWARDIGPTFVLNAKGEVRGIDWQFNAWGGSYDGLYPSWDKDDQAASEFCRQLDLAVYDAHPFVLEGGAIHSDGEGTVMVTEACLLSPGRNPHMTKGEIEEKLKEYLAAEKIIWLPYGIYNDETNQHVDNICAFIKPGEVVLAWTDDASDPQYAMSKADLEFLETVRDAKGRKLKIHLLPIPKKAILVREKDLEGYQFEEGEERREVGERLAASYVNFYISNDTILMPVFGDEHDGQAIEILTELFPERRVYPLMARDILLGGGNIHCITQQIPGRKEREADR